MEEIDRLYAAWSDAFADADVDALLALLTDDYVVWYPGAVLRREELRPRLVAAFAAYDITSRFEREDLIVSGDLAVDVGWDVQELRSREGGADTQVRRRVMLVLRRDRDRWRFARGMSQP